MEGEEARGRCLGCGWRKWGLGIRRCGIGSMMLLSTDTVVASRRRGVLLGALWVRWMAECWLEKLRMLNKQDGGD